MDETIQLRVLLDVLKAAAVLAPIALAALAWWARRHFATRPDLDALGEKVNAQTTLTYATRERLAKTEDALERLEERMRTQWERTVETIERVSETMDRISGEQRQIAKEQAGMASDLKHLLARLRD